MQNSIQMAVRGGEVVTSAGRSHADIGITDGKVVQIGGTVGSAEIEIDAVGKIVIPGGVDMHVHFTPAYLPKEAREGATEEGDADSSMRVMGHTDDFESGSRAAAAGGITTVGNMTFPKVGESPVDALTRVATEDTARSVVDYVQHPVIREPSLTSPDDLVALAESGYRSMKLFMNLESFEAGVGHYLALMKVAGEHNVLTMIHCEDACIVSFLGRSLVREGRGHASNYPLSRPIYAEAVAVARAIAWAEATKAPIYVVHLSSNAALEITTKAKNRGIAVYVETRPIYLFFTEADFQGPEAGLYVGNPPLRTDYDVRTIWAGLASGSIDTCCTDHAPRNRDEKLDPSRDVTTVSPGMPDLDTLMPLLYSEGVLKGKLSLERFVDVTSTNAAKLFGIYPQKGTIAVGSDADMVVWNPEDTREFRAIDLFSRADFSLYEGWKITGWPDKTIRRGQVIYDGRHITVDGGGQEVRMGPAGML